MRSEYKKAKRASYRANNTKMLSVKTLQASDMIEELQHGVCILKQQLQDSEHQRQQQLRVSPELFTQE